MVTACKANDILGTLFALYKEFSNNYCFPSQKKILELLERFHRCKISIATLNRWLRVIEDEGYIKRTRRIKHDPKFGMVFKSTLYKILPKGFRKLGMLGVAVKAWLGGKENGNNNHKPGPRSGPGKNARVGKMAPIKDIINGVLKCPVIAESAAGSK